MAKYLFCGLFSRETQEDGIPPIPPPIPPPITLPVLNQKQRKKPHFNASNTVEKSVEFIDKRLRALLNEDSSNPIKTMYERICNCLDERLASHVMLIANCGNNLKKINVRENVLLNGYMDIIEKPEWKLNWSNYLDVVEHPYFAEYWKVKLQSDEEYLNNFQSCFERMFQFVRKRRDFLKKNQKSRSLKSLFNEFHSNLDEFAVRELLVLSSCYKNQIARMEDYLLVKYGLKPFSTPPIDFNCSWRYFEDTEKYRHPFYAEYFSAMQSVKQRHSFKFIYKPAAETWINHRLNCDLPPIVSEMYKMLQTELTGLRAYEMFAISQFHMKRDQIERLEKYLSEKYRKYLGDPKQDGLMAIYAGKSIDLQNFEKHYPLIAKILNDDKQANPTFTNQMFTSATYLLQQKMKTRRTSSSKVKFYKFLLESETRCQEVLAVQNSDVKEWDSILQERYCTEFQNWSLSI